MLKKITTPNKIQTDCALTGRKDANLVDDKKPSAEPSDHAQVSPLDSLGRCQPVNGSAEGFSSLGSRMQVSPFTAQGHFTTVHNALFDAVMPHLGPNAWKVLCAILRETRGWGREDAQLNNPTLRKLTGISSASTLAAAVDELLAFQCEGRPCPLISVAKGAKWEAHAYRLNRKVRLAWYPSASRTEATDEAAPPITETVTPITKTVTGEPVTKTVTPITETVTDGLLQKLEQEPITVSVTSYRKEESILTEEKKKERTCAEAHAGAAAPVLPSTPRKKTASRAPADERSKHPAIVAFRDTVEKFPAKDQYEIVIDAIGEKPDLERLRACRREWRERGHSPVSLKWVTEWYVHGIPKLVIASKGRTAAEHNHGGRGLVQ